MTPLLMNTPKKITLIIAAIILVGVGCKAGKSPVIAPIADINESAPITNATPTDVTDSLIDTRIIDAKPEIDETWETYVNKSYGFTFNWPTRGRYAPQWSVTFIKNDDERLDGDCIKATSDPTKLIVSETEFCHTSTTAENNASASDYFITKIADHYTLLTFTKDNSQTPEGFSWEDYRLHLDNIISTYQTNE